MTETSPPPKPAPVRGPKVFSIDDPTLVIAEPPAAAAAAGEAAPMPPGVAQWRGRPSLDEVAEGFRWGALFVSAAVALAALAAALMFGRFVSAALARQDWLGWVAFALLTAMLLAGVVLIGRELVGLYRLRRLGRLRLDADAALANRDTGQERAVAARLQALTADRADLAWGRARFAEHQGDVHDPGSLLALADRELMVPLDTAARRSIYASAKRVAMVTAMSPIAALSVGFVLVENLRLMRGLAGQYGGRPGFIGGLRLARLVVTHLIATGGVALTDDWLGQFIGQGILQKLSRRAGTGLFNATLTARLGTAAIDVCRPLPYIEAPPVRARDIVAEIMRKSEAAPEAESPATGAKRV
jgi:putative membrane protein